MTEATRKIKFLNREYEKKMKALEGELNKKYLREITKLKKTYRKCPVEMNEYSKKFNSKTGKITEVKNGKKCGCGEYTNKKDWIKVSVEDISIQTVSYDSGYGDDDELAYVRHKDYYSVCPNCHKMVWDRFEILGQSSTFVRRGSDSEDVDRAKRFIPDGWKPIVKIEKK